MELTLRRLQRPLCVGVSNQIEKQSERVNFFFCSCASAVQKRLYYMCRVVVYVHEFALRSLRFFVWHHSPTPARSRPPAPRAPHTHRAGRIWQQNATWKIRWPFGTS